MNMNNLPIFPKTPAAFFNRVSSGGHLIFFKCEAEKAVRLTCFGQQHSALSSTIYLLTGM
ncbi:hypothetical protein BDZ97DRAFT_1798641, partial [Flammula alnicola]